jgi:replicative DNA helicase
VTAELTPDDVEVGWSSLAETASYAHFRPLSEAAHRFIADTRTDNRVFTGIGPLDVEMRGISAGHLALIVGYSHSGKTLVALHIIGNNQAKRIAYFVPDEPAPLVLTKLACMSWGVSGAELEGRVADGDPWGVKVLNETVEQYSNLAVFDRALTPRAMQQGYAEACDNWGAPADLVIVDYLDLVQAGDSVMGKADFVKSFGTEHEVPMIVLHQTSRSAGSKGQAMRIDSGGYGGETHATFQIGVWRKKAAIIAELADLQARDHKSEWCLDRMSELDHQLAIHQYTLSVNLNKNKRPSGHLVDTLDFEIDLDSGVLTPLYPGSIPSQMRGLRSVQ